MVQTKLRFQLPLYIAVYCCILSKSPTERWGSHSCSSSEIQNVVLAVESSPAKQHSLSPEHSITVPGVQLHTAASSAEHSASAVGHSVGVILYCTPPSLHSQTHCLTPAIQHTPTAAVCSCMKIADTSLRWLQQHLVIHCKNYTLLLQFPSYSLPPPLPDQPALRNVLCDWQIKHYY